MFYQISSVIPNQICLLYIISGYSSLLGKVFWSAHEIFVVKYAPFVKLKLQKHDKYLIKLLNSAFPNIVIIVFVFFEELVTLLKTYWRIHQFLSICSQQQNVFEPFKSSRILRVEDLYLYFPALFSYTPVSWLQIQQTTSRVRFAGQKLIIRRNIIV